jgi:hypothetical protein
MELYKEKRTNFFTRGLSKLFTTAGFTGMPATVLPLNNLDSPVAQNKIELPMKRHLNRHI